MTYKATITQFISRTVIHPERLRSEVILTPYFAADVFNINDDIENTVPAHSATFDTEEEALSFTNRYSAKVL